jgi:putative tricarboxylic transport membrane protein
MPSRILLLAISLLVISAVLWVATYDIPGPTSWQTYGSARFPRILIGTLAGLSVLLLVRELLSGDRSNAFRDIAAWVRSEKRILGGMVLFGLYIFALPKAGFIAATMVYLAASLTVLWYPLSRRKVLISGAICIAATFGVFFVFESVLGIRLP